MVRAIILIVILLLPLTAEARGRRRVFRVGPIRSLIREGHAAADAMYRAAHEQRLMVQDFERLIDKHPEMLEMMKLYDPSQRKPAVRSGRGNDRAESWTP